MIRGMPFTPFHLGPALCLGLPFRKYIHTPTFILANVIVDVEPFLVLILGLYPSYRLHGYAHTFVAAFVVGPALGYIMFLFERTFHPLYKTLLLQQERMRTLKPFIVAGISGIFLHVLLDSPLYSDIQPFFPSKATPLYNPDLSIEVYSLCVWLGILGIALYAGLSIFLIYRGKIRGKEQNKVTAS